MKRNPHSPVTEMLSSEYKIWLYAALGFMLAVDCGVCVWLWVYGIGAEYYAVPLVLAIVDALYLTSAFFSNLRFGYARNAFAVYTAATVAACVAWVIIINVNDTVFTSLAQWLTVGVRFVGVFAVISAYFVASRRLRLSVAASRIFAGTVAAACLSLCVYYGVSLFTDGYFGQGGGRQLVYEITDNDSCVVVGVLDGNADGITVPREFDGHKVTTVSAELFRTRGIKNITLECDADITFRDINKLNDASRSVALYVPRAEIDEYRHKFFELSDSMGIYGAFDMANNVRPSGLASDEAYITFSYDETAYSLVGGSVLPTWIGKKGDVFRLDDIDDGQLVEYVKHTDIRSDEDLFWSYRSGGMMMDALTVNDIDINGARIMSSCAKVPVNFRKVYAVVPGESNDARCPTDKFFDCATVDGVKHDCKYTVADTADELLAPFKRDGFGLEWKFNGGGLDSYMTSLADTLEKCDSSRVEIKPVWTLAAPDVTFEGQIGAVVTYGDRLSITSAVSHPLIRSGSTDYKLDYYWSGPESAQGVKNGKIDIPSAKMNDGGNYSLTVTISAPNLTSLSAQKTVTKYVTVQKRTLTIDWSVVGGNVYDGNVKTVTASINNDLPEDNVTLTGSRFLYTDAGTYTSSARLEAKFTDRYEIAGGIASHTFTIAPRPTEIRWFNDTFVYDGTSPLPSATADGVDGRSLNVAIDSSANTDVGTYSAHGELTDGNYVAATGTENHEYRITPRPVDVVWNNKSLIYNGAMQSPTPTAAGVDGKALTFTVSGRAENVGEYTATATLTNGNYTIATGRTEVYSIAPYEATVNWLGSTELVYNGTAQRPAVSVTGVNGHSVRCTVTGAGENVGSYRAEISSNDGNYTLKGETSKPFTVVPRPVNIVWSNTLLTYNGGMQAPTASAVGVGGNALTVNVSGMMKNAGQNYSATATLADGNYSVGANGSVRFTIAKKTVTVTVRSFEIEYGAAVPTLTGTVSGFVAGEQPAIEYKINYENDEKGFIPVGKYDIMVVFDRSDNYDYVIVGGSVTVK